MNAWTVFVNWVLPMLGGFAAGYFGTEIWTIWKKKRRLAKTDGAVWAENLETAKKVYAGDQGLQALDYLEQLIQTDQRLRR